MSNLIKYKLKLQILKFNYWETYKHSKDLDYVLPIDDPKRIELVGSLNELQKEINDLDIKIKKLEK